MATDPGAHCEANQEGQETVEGNEDLTMVFTSQSWEQVYHYCDEGLNSYKLQT